PPASQEVVERIVGVVGRDASTQPLPALPAPGVERDAGDHASPTDSMDRPPFAGRGEDATTRQERKVEGSHTDATTLRWERPEARPRPRRRWILPASLGVGLLVAAGVSAQRMLAGSVRVSPTAAAVSSTAPALPSEVTETRAL